MFLKALESLFDSSSGTEHEFKFGLFTPKKKKKNLVQCNAQSSNFLYTCGGYVCLYLYLHVEIKSAERETTKHR